MPDSTFYAFLDESGTIGWPGGTHFLVVALVETNQPLKLEMPVRRALKKYGLNLKVGEVKAANFEEKAITRLLEEIAREDILIFTTVVDQSIVDIPDNEKENIYRQAVADTIYRLVKNYPYMNICLDRRYTNERHRSKLETQIRERIQYLPQKIIITQEISTKRKELQAADAVSWAIYQKYEHNDVRFYKIISSKIVSEVLIQEKDWLK